MSSIVPVVILFVIVVIVGAIALGFFGLASGYERLQEDLQQAEERRKSNPELDYHDENLGGGFIKLFHAVSDATALFDPNTKLLHLNSEVLGNRTEDCASHEDACMTFEDYLRGIYDSKPVELNHEG